MKRTIFVIFILTVLVTSPPLFLKGFESQRLKRIQEIKQQARPIFGEPFEKIISELNNKNPPSVVILYTGNTKSHLEPCGCYQEQSGGLSRRAYVIERIRERGYPTLVVDAGNIFNGQEEIDTERCRTNIRALSEMDYSAIALSDSDLAYDDTYLAQQKEVATFPFLVSRDTQKEFTQSYVMQKAGQYTVAIVAGTVPQQVVSAADLVVALGHPKKPEHIDIVILPDEVETEESDTKTVSVGSQSDGKTLGVVAVWIDADGEIANHYTSQIALTGEVGESVLIRQMLTDFYRSTIDSTKTSDFRLFVEQILEKQNRGYISAETCKSCHEQEYIQWSGTRHAFAYQTLLKKERYFDRTYAFLII